MIEILTTYLPPDVSLQSALILVVTTLFTSTLTAAFGLGGGLILLAVAANLLAPAVVIPVHGVVQFGNNVIRASLYGRHINWPIFLWFSIGALIGGAVGINLVMGVSREVLQLTLGLFVLYSAIGPNNFKRPFGRSGQVLSGIATTFSTLFVGATGPLVAALLPTKKMERMEVLGTHGALMALQHGLKIALFGFAGFAFAPWIWLLGAMFCVGLAGNLLGKKIQGMFSEQYFRRIFQILLVALAARLIISAIISWI